MRFFNFKNKINFRKRAIFSIFIAGGLIALCNSLWLVKIAKHHYSFQFDIFFIVLIISLLIGYKLSNYLAEFKTVKNNSRVDIVFLFIFFVLLFLPVSRIDNSLKAKYENRFLETYKPLIKENGSINYNYGNDFEKFFNDRFFLRNSLISKYHLIKAIFAYKYYETSRVIYVKRNNYVVSKTHIPKEGNFSKKIIDKTVYNLNKFNDFCIKNHIKLYVLVVPYNQHIYQDEIKPFDNPEGLKALNNNVKEFQAKTKAKVIYPFDELMAASKKERTFFKTDHHWTDYGAYISYLSLMKEIKKDYPNLKVLNENDFDYQYSKKVRNNMKREFKAGAQLQMEARFLLPLKKIILDTDYKYFKYKNKDLIAEKYVEDERENSRKTYFPAGANYRVILTGNSMGMNIHPFLASTFKSTKHYYLLGAKIKDSERYKIMKYYKKDIIDYKPDIIVLVLTCNVLKHINDFFLEEEN